MNDGLIFPIYIGEDLDYTYLSIAKQFNLKAFQKFNTFDDYKEILTAGVTLYRLIKAAKEYPMN